MRSEEKKKSKAGFFIALAVVFSLIEEIMGEFFGGVLAFLVIGGAIFVLLIYNMKREPKQESDQSYTYNYDDLKRDDLIDDYDTRQRNKCPECGYRIMPNDTECGFCGKKVKYRG